jgi:hypothetical protein
MGGGECGYTLVALTKGDAMAQVKYPPLKYSDSTSFKEREAYAVRFTKRYPKDEQGLPKLYIPFYEFGRRQKLSIMVAWQKCFGDGRYVLLTRTNVMKWLRFRCVLPDHSHARGVIDPLVDFFEEFIGQTSYAVKPGQRSMARAAFRVFQRDTNDWAEARTEDWRVNAPPVKTCDAFFRILHLAHHEKVLSNSYHIRHKPRELNR